MATKSLTCNSIFCHDINPSSNLLEAYLTKEPQVQNCGLHKFISVRSHYEWTSHLPSISQMGNLYLATIHNFSEMNDLINLVSGSTIAYTNWREGNPQDNDQDACVAVDENGKWFEKYSPCTNYYLYFVLSQITWF
uniref:C-type lectin domain-containing protein n=1 Tax=Periophthalmus magnuspinnatus TaxID=409849 RepID=A0A3B3ZYJ3_9GOBI